MFKFLVMRGAVKFNNAIIRASEKIEWHLGYNATRSPIYTMTSAYDDREKPGKYPTIFLYNFTKICRTSPTK